jgi:hypothetical protein
VLGNNCWANEKAFDKMKGREIHILLLLGLFSITIAHEDGYCLTDEETDTIISRWTSIAIKIDLKVVDETVTDNFQFFSDSRDFLEGLPVSLPKIFGASLKATLILNLHRQSMALQTVCRQSRIRPT